MKTTDWGCQGGSGGGEGKMGDSGQLHGGEHEVVYTDVEVKCCTPETYNVKTSVTSILKNSCPQGSKCPAQPVTQAQKSCTQEASWLASPGSRLFLPTTVLTGSYDGLGLFRNGN